MPDRDGIHVPGIADPAAAGESPRQTPVSDPVLTHPFTLADAPGDDATAICAEETATVSIEATHETATVLRLKPGGTTDPKSHDALWRLVPTGRAAPSGHPLYWIVQYVPALLPAFCDGAWTDLELMFLSLSTVDSIDALSPMIAGRFDVLSTPERRHEDWLTWHVLPWDEPAAAGGPAQPYRLSPARLATDRPAGGMGFHGKCLLHMEVVSFQAQGRLYLRFHDA